MFIKAYEYGALLLAALVFYFFLVFLQTGKVWSQEIEQGVGVVCDHATEVRRFIQVYKDDAQAAAEQVNKEVKSPTACIIGHVLFIRGDPAERENGWVITAILVVAVQLPHGWQAIAPAKFFTAFKVEERGA